MDAIFTLYVPATRALTVGVDPDIVVERYVEPVPWYVAAGYELCPLYVRTPK
jgi:hypothetical protein